MEKDKDDICESLKMTEQQAKEAAKTSADMDKTMKKLTEELELNLKKTCTPGEIWNPTYPFSIWMHEALLNTSEYINIINIILIIILIYYNINNINIKNINVLIILILIIVAMFCHKAVIC